MRFSLFYAAAWEMQNYRLNGSMDHWNLILCLLHIALSIGNTLCYLFFFFFFFNDFFTIVSEYVLEFHKLTWNTDLLLIFIFFPGDKRVQMYVNDLNL